MDRARDIVETYIKLKSDLTVQVLRFGEYYNWTVWHHITHLRFKNRHKLLSFTRRTIKFYYVTDIFIRTRVPIKFNLISKWTQFRYIA